MIRISNELKETLLAAGSPEELAARLKEAGMDDSAAGQLWNEIGKCREEKELSLDELETVSGGADRDWLREGCAATVEPGSWCGTNDKCYWIDITYDHVPIKDPCPRCGGRMYIAKTEIKSKYKTYYHFRCIHCGHVVVEKR